MNVYGSATYARRVDIGGPSLLVAYTSAAPSRPVSTRDTYTSSSSTATARRSIENQTTSTAGPPAFGTRTTAPASVSARTNHAWVSSSARLVPRSTDAS